MGKFLGKKYFWVYNSKSKFRKFFSRGRTQKSELAALEIIRAATKPNSTVLYISPFKNCRQGFWKLINDMLSTESISKTRLVNQEIKLINGSLILVRGANCVDSFRGTSLDFLVIDDYQDVGPDLFSKVLRATLCDRQGGALFISEPIDGKDEDLKKGFQCWSV